jgi:hypothetical protein
MKINKNLKTSQITHCNTELEKCEFLDSVWCKNKKVIKQSRKRLLHESYINNNNDVVHLFHRCSSCILFYHKT